MPRGNKTFSMLNSAEHEVYPAHKCLMPTFVGILTFISMINTASERLKLGNFFICWCFSFYEQLSMKNTCRVFNMRSLSISCFLSADGQTLPLLGCL